MQTVTLRNESPYALELDVAFNVFAEASLFIDYQEEVTDLTFDANAFVDVTGPSVFSAGAFASVNGGFSCFEADELAPGFDCFGFDPNDFSDGSTSVSLFLAPYDSASFEMTVRVFTITESAAVPLPRASWLVLTGLAGLIVLKRKSPGADPGLSEISVGKDYSSSAIASISATRALSAAPLADASRSTSSMIAMGAMSP